MRRATILAAASVTAPFLAAEADERFYSNASYSVYDGDGVTLNAVTLRAGGYINDIFGLEAEGSFAAGEDRVRQDVSAELNQQLAGYVTARLPVGARGDIYTRLGYGSVQIRSTEPAIFDGTVEEDFDLNGATLGIGGHYDLTDRVALRGDLSAFEGDEGSLNIFSAGLVFRF